MAAGVLLTRSGRKYRQGWQVFGGLREAQSTLRTGLI
jgi:hypothetical protein